MAASAGIDKYYSCVRPEVMDLVPTHARMILDVGCGSGNLGAHLKVRQPAVVHGVELVPHIADKARSQLDRVWNGTIEDAIPHLEDALYDCIVVADVLEHLAEPWAVLCSLRKKLAPGGVVVASIPNVQNWDVVSALIEGRFDYRSQGILDRTHLRFFTRKSFEELFWNAGLRLRTISTSNSGSSAAPALLRAMAKSGLSQAPLALDGQTFQFLAVAELPQSVAPPRVVVVVHHWDDGVGALQCAKSVQELRYSNYEFVFVDSSSSGEAAEQIRRRHPGGCVLRVPANLGYAAGANNGLRWALERDSEYVLLIDTRTRLTPHILDALAGALAFLPRDCVLGTKVVFADRPDTVWSAGGYWVPERCAFERIGHGEPDGAAFSYVRQVHHVAGSALFAHSETFRRIGLLDERFFDRSTEIDWCYRATNGGLKCITIPDAIVWALPNTPASIGSSDTYFDCRNKLLWARKHLGRGARRALHRHVLRTVWDLVVPPLTLAKSGSFALKPLFWSCVSWFRGIKRNARDANRRAALLGFRDYYLGRFGDCPVRVRRLVSSATARAQDRGAAKL